MSLWVVFFIVFSVFLSFFKFSAKLPLIHIVAKRFV